MRKQSKNGNIASITVNIESEFMRHYKRRKFEILANVREIHKLIKFCILNFEITSCLEK